MFLRNRRRLETTLEGLVKLGKLQRVLPSTDSGYVSYGAGRLFLPAVTNVCPDPQGTLADGTFWPASTANTVLTANQPLPIPIADQPLITKCLKLVNDGTADTPGTANLTVTQSKDYMVSLYVFAPTLGGNLTITSETGDAHTVAALTTAGSGWTRYNVNSHTSAGQTTLHLHFAFTGGTASTVYVTGLLVAQESVLTPYGDGSYSGWAWSGTANASTSTRAASKLEFPTTGLLGATLPATGTVAARCVPLFASTATVSNPRIVDIGLTGISVTPAGLYFPIANCVGMLVGATAVTSAFTFPLGTVISAVGRWSSSLSTDVSAYGATGTAVASTTGQAVDAIRIGDRNGDRPIHAYIGPVFISPTRITDAQTTNLSAMLTAGATGLDLARWCIANGLTNSLVLPLQSDSVGYLVMS